MKRIPTRHKRSWSLQTRALNLLDRLDARLEEQKRREGADAPRCVEVVGVFDTFAGGFERALDRRIRLGWRELIVSELRALRRIARDHAVLVSMEGQRIRMARRATVQKVIRAAKRGHIE